MVIEPRSAIELQTAIDRLERREPKSGPRSALPPPIVIGGRIRSIGGIAKALMTKPAVFAESRPRVVWAMLRAAEVVTASMEERRLLQDDRAELALAEWRRCCLGEPGASMFDVKTSLHDATMKALASEAMDEAIGYESLSGLAHSAGDMLNGRGSAEAFVRSTSKAAWFLQRPGEPDGEGKAKVFVALVEALAEDGPSSAPMESISNPGAVTVATSPIIKADRMDAEVARIFAYVGGRNVGELMLTRVGADELSRPCAAGYRSILRANAEAHERSPIGVLTVSNVSVVPAARNLGVGVALYLAAARVARESFNSVIASHDCVGGQTSGDAERVWDSARFAGSVHASGGVAWWTG